MFLARGREGERRKREREGGKEEGREGRKEEKAKKDSQGTGNIVKLF